MQAVHFLLLCLAYKKELLKLHQLGPVAADQRPMTRKIAIISPKQKKEEDTNGITWHN